jgi:hypothetical protein
MNSKIIFSLLAFVSSILIFGGCKKKEDVLGHEYVAAPSNFVVLGDAAGVQLKAYNVIRSTGFHQTTAMYHADPAHPMKVSLNTAFQYYTAKFSSTVSWTLTLTSTKTHAVKEFHGLSDFIDSTNTKWDGSSDNDYFFGYAADKDTAEVKLTFVGSDIVVKDITQLTGAKPYHLKTIKGIFHYLVDDFDGGNPACIFSPFYPDAADVGGGNIGNSAYYNTKVQGNYSYRMYGRDVNNNTYIGSCNTPTLNDIPAGTFATTNTQFPATDPNNIYINLYIYGTGKVNSNVSVIVFENDANQLPGTTFNQNINDKYIYYIPVTWTGWQLVSFKYSGFIVPNTGGRLGNNTRNPDKLCGLALEMDSYPIQGYEVEAFVDMVFVTQGGPFQK